MQWSYYLLKEADRQSVKIFSLSQLLGAADICDYMVRIIFSIKYLLCFCHYSYLMTIMTVIIVIFYSIKA